MSFAAGKVRERYMAFKRAIKLLKRKDNYRLKEIKKRHGRSLEMSLENVAVVGDNAWEVKSANSNYNAYSVSCVSSRARMKTVKSDALNATHVFINIVATAPTVLSHTQYANIFTWSEDTRWKQWNIQLQANNGICQQNN